MSRRTFLRRTGYALGATLLAGSGLFFYGTRFEPRLLEIVRLKVALRLLPRAFDGLTIVQISDLHFGPFVGPEEGRAVVDVVMGLKPQMVAITGDHASRATERETDLIVDVYSRLSAPLGVYAIMGNHDHWTNHAAVDEAIRGTRVTLLRNTNVAVEQAGDVLYIAGVDDVWERQDDLPLALKGVPDQGLAILLAHEPDFADEASNDRRVALQISGHSHGGQVRLPGLGPLRLPSLARRYPAGLFDVGSMRLYVNRGIGVVSPPVRFNCRPEVTLLELVAS